MRIAVFILAIALGGCSLFFAPDPNRVHRDGGQVDGGHEPDGGPDRDGGPDAGPPCVASETPHERSCDDHMDNDCDGYTDCDDFSCASAAECCGEGGPLFPVEDWGDLNDWLELSAVHVTRSGGYLSDFGTTTVPNAILHRGCAPLDLGASFVIQVRRPAACGGAGCDDYATFVLTSTAELPPGGSLETPFGVRIGGDGMVTIRRASEVLWTFTSAVPIVSTPSTIRIDLTPGLEAGNVPTLFARVIYTPSGLAAEEHTVSVMTLHELHVVHDRCEDARFPPLVGDGLYPAIEGQGTAIDIGSITTTELSCANPSLFRPSTALSTASLTLDPAWTMGGIGAPSVQRYLYSGSETWELWVDGSQVPRDNKGFQRVDYAIGGAASSNGGSVWAARNSGAAVFGTATGWPSYVEPDVFAHLNADYSLNGDTMRLAYARQEPTPDAGVPDGGFVDITPAYAIYGHPAVPRDAVVPIAEVTAPVLTPAQVPTCRSLRDPFLLPVSDQPTDGLWLLFTCERRSTTAGVLYITHLNDSLVADGGPLSAHVVLDLSHEVYATGGISGGDAVADFGPDNSVTYRLWTLARNGSGSHLAYAEAHGQMGTEPVFEVYPANPILEPHDPVLGDCTGNCALTGVTATRLSDTEVQLVVSHDVDDGGMTRHELVPLVQIRRRE